MIKYGDSDIIARYWGDKAVQAVYHGARLVWQLISSCFGAGYWRNDFPWKNSDGWKN